MTKYLGKDIFSWLDIIYLIVLISILYWCIGCTYNSSSLKEEDEYIIIYDKNWKTKYYGKIRKSK